MANKYCNLDGTKKIKDEYKKINVGFDLIETDVNNLDTKIDNVDSRLYTKIVNVDSRLDTKIDNVDSKVNTIITTPAESVSAQEIIDARKGKPTLGAKIDEMDNKFATHKADIEDKINIELISRRNRKPMITIIDDDCRKGVITKWVPILQQKDFKLTIACITNLVGSTDYMTWEELKTINRDYPVDIVNHTHTHPVLGNLTEMEIVNEFETSRDLLDSHGFTSRVLVYPYGSQNALVRQIARNYFDAAIYTGGGINYPPISTYVLKRISMLYSSTPMSDLADYKAHIDEAIENNGWLIYMSHSQYDTFDSEKIKQIIDYANANGIEWVDVNEGLKNIGNIIDIGDYQGAEYTIIDCDGILYSRSNSKDCTVLRTRYEEPISTPLTDFPRGLSYHIVPTAEATGFPENRAGVLETFRVENSEPLLVYNYQLYHPYYTNKVYKRTWNRTSKTWSDFDLLMTQSDYEAQNSYKVYTGGNVFSASTPLTDYPNNKITTFIVNLAGGTGFPDNTAGIVTTYRIFDAAWGRQEFRKYKSNEIWSRYWDNGEWTAWVKIGY